MESKREDIRAAEQRVAAAEQELRDANQAWLDSPLGQDGYLAARRRWMEADNELMEAVYALNALEGELNAI